MRANALRSLTPRLLAVALCLELSILVPQAEGRVYKPKDKSRAPTPTTIRQSDKRAPKVKLRTSDFLCDGCLAGQTIRAVYLEGTDAVENPAAIEAAALAHTNYPCGSCCADPVMARPECFVFENWNKGFVNKITADVFGKLGANVIAMTPANYTSASLEAAGSSTFERCIWEVYFGNIDICVGTVWETGDRRSRVAFSSPLDIATFLLVTKAKLGAGGLRVLSIFDPFTWQVWATMLGMFVFMALLMWVVQSDPLAPETDLDEREIFPKPRGLAKTFWMSLMGYAAGPDYTTASWASKFIVLGYAFFLYITVSSYTANLASFMVLQDRAAGDISSLQDIVDQGLKLCTLLDMDGMISQPGLSDDRRVKTNHFGAAMELLYTSECVAAVTDQYRLATMIQASTASYVFCNDTKDGNYGKGYFCFEEDSQLGVVDLSTCVCSIDDTEIGDCPADKIDCSDKHKFCNFIRVDDPSFTANINVAMPTMDWLEPYFSAWIVSLKQTGEVGNYLSTEFWEKNPMTCESNTAQGSTTADAEASALDLNSMAGTYIISGSLMMVGVVIHIIKQLLAGRAKSADQRKGSKSDIVFATTDVEAASAMGSSGGASGELMPRKNSASEKHDGALLNSQLVENTSSGPDKGSGNSQLRKEMDSIKDLIRTEMAKLEAKLGNKKSTPPVPTQGGRVPQEGRNKSFIEDPFGVLGINISGNGQS